MRRIGIVCDEYKLKRFREELLAKDYKHTEAPFTKGKNATWSLVIEVESIEYNFHVLQIKRLCQRLENEFKRGNN